MKSELDRILLEEQEGNSIVAEIPVKTQSVLDSVTQHKGHTMFEIDCSTGIIIPANYDEVNINLGGQVRKKILTKSNCLYISCLNKKSAQKKFLKWVIENQLLKRRK